MSWANHAKELLRAGHQVVIKPRGHSMSGRVESGDLVTLIPATFDDVEVGDIVLVRVKRRDYLHLIKAKDNERLLIGNNRGGTNGWIGANGLYGKAIKVERT